MKRRLAPGTGVFLATVIVLIGFILSWHFFGKMNPYSSLMPGEQTVGATPIELTGVEVHSRAGGHLVWQVGAESLTISSDRQTITSNGLSEGVFYSGAAPVLRFAAKRLVYNVPQFFAPSSFVLSGGIDLWSIGGYRGIPANIHVSTPIVSWDSRTSTALFPAPISFEASGLGRGTAVGLSIDTLRRLINFNTVSVATSALTAGSVSPAKTDAKAPTDDSQVTYNASDGYWDENNRILTIIGPVTFHQGKANVTMTGATYDQKTNVASSSSPIKIVDDDAGVTGDHGTIDFSKHIAILIGHVMMTVLPKQSDKVSESEVKKPTTISCDQINYYYRTKKAKTTGAVIIKQTNRTVIADSGLYDVTAKVVDLVGNVVGTSTDGKLIKSPHAKLSVDQDDEWIRLDGPITGTFKVSDDDNPQASSDKPLVRDAGNTKESQPPPVVPSPMTPKLDTAPASPSAATP